MKFVSGKDTHQNILKYSMSFSIFIDKLEEKLPFLTFWISKVTVKRLHRIVELSQALFKYTSYLLEKVTY